MNLFVEYLQSHEVKKELTIPVIITQCNSTWYIDQESYRMIFGCNHEEADYRMVLHASLHDTLCVIRSKDTDVLVLMAYGYKKKSPASNWFMQYDTDKYADIRKIVEHLGDHITSSLPQLHALTGCDTTSSFFNHGKMTILKKVLKNPSKIDLIQGLGSELILSDETSLMP